MKTIKILFIASIALLMASCGVAGSGNDNSQPTDLVMNAINQQELSVEVTYINPMRGPSRPSTDGYRITVRDGKVSSYLPFFGISRMASGYGMEPAGIEFKDYPVMIDERQSNPAKGKYVWQFEAKSGSERVLVVLTFWNNGSAQIMCNPANRSVMNYSGELVALPEKKD